jgi:hypothetical protein
MRYVIMPDRLSIFDTQQQRVVTRLSKPTNAILYVAGMNRAHKWARS